MGIHGADCSSLWGDDAHVSAFVLFAIYMFGGGVHIGAPWSTHVSTSATAEDSASGCLESSDVCYACQTWNGQALWAVLSGNPQPCGQPGHPSLQLGSAPRLCQAIAEEMSGVPGLDKARQALTRWDPWTGKGGAMMADYHPEVEGAQAAAYPTATENEVLHTQSKRLEGLRGHQGFFSQSRKPALEMDRHCGLPSLLTNWP